MLHEAIVGAEHGAGNGILARNQGAMRAGVLTMLRYRR